MRIRLAVVVVIVACTEAYSCTCDGPSQGETRREIAEWYAKQPGVSLIFEGQISTISMGKRGMTDALPSNSAGAPSTALPTTSSDQFRAVDFIISRRFRGEAPDRVSVYTGFGADDCGYDFQLNHSYLVYASKRPDGSWFTSTCSGTQDMDGAGAAVRLLTGERATSEDLLTPQHYRLCEKFNLSDEIFLGRVLERGFTEIEVQDTMSNLVLPPRKVWQEVFRVAVLERFLEVPADLKPARYLREMKGEVSLRFPMGYLDRALRNQRGADSRVQVGDTYLFYFPAEGMRSPPDWYPPRIVPIEQAPLANLRRLRKMKTASLHGHVPGWYARPPDAQFLARVLKRETTEIENPLADKAKSRPRVQIEVVRVAVVESFRGMPETEVSIFAPVRNTQGKILPEPYIFKNVVPDIGATYYFIADRIRSRWYTLFAAPSSRASARLEELRQLKEIRPGQPWESAPRTAIAISQNKSFETRAHVSQAGEYHFPALPPGFYTFAVEQNGVEHEVYGAGARLVAGGCTKMELESTGGADWLFAPSVTHTLPPTRDCAWAAQYPSLCEKFNASRAVFVGRILRRGNQIQARNPDDRESPFTGYEVHVAPIKRFRGLTEKSQEVIYDIWDKFPTCSGDMKTGETYLIFADYYQYYFEPYLFQKLDKSVERQVRECERKH